METNEKTQTVALSAENLTIVNFFQEARALLLMSQPDENSDVVSGVFEKMTEASRSFNISDSVYADNFNKEFLSLISDLKFLWRENSYNYTRQTTEILDNLTEVIYPEDKGKLPKNETTKNFKKTLIRLKVMLRMEAKTIKGLEKNKKKTEGKNGKE